MKITQKYRKVMTVGLWLAGSFIILLTLAALALAIYIKSLGPPPLAVSQSTIFYASNGTKIGETNTGQKRYWVNYGDISEHVLHATIAIEDRKFHQHFGFDLKRIIGAAYADIKSMAKVQGASTITQQYARNLFLGHDKTWKRKLQEALYTLRLEAHYSKEEILEGYLNTIYYGHGMYGIEAAATYYFNKPASELTLSEASILAGIPKGPSYYSPKFHYDRSKARQKIVLKAMAKQNYISQDEVNEAWETDLHLQYTIKEETREKLAPYFQDIVKHELVNMLGIEERLIDRGGLKVYTTLDLNVQEIAEAVVDLEMDKDTDVQASLVSMDPKTGAIFAMIGGTDYKKSPYNRAVQARRQPGSTFKPFVYYAALENGFTPSTQLLSKPTSFTFDDGRSTYSPSNYNNYYEDGPITLAQAIAISDNIYAVKTHLFLGIDKVIENIRKFGIDNKLDDVPSLALGTSLMSVKDMTNAYAVIANGGKKVDPHVIEKVLDQKGNVLYERQHEEKQLLTPSTAYILSHLMEGMFDERLNGAYMRVTGAVVNPLLTRPMSGKSGSTETDSWMIGFTPQLVTGVWVGYDDNRKMQLVKELKYAKKIWARVMEESLKGKPIERLKRPKDVIPVTINPQNGKLATEACPIRKNTFFEKGEEPLEYCKEHIVRDPGANEKEKRKKKPKDDWLQQFLDKLF
jgi:penicillin-binding protein 2D